MAGDNFARTVQVSSDPDKAFQTLTDVELMAGWVEIVHDVKEITHLEKYAAVLQDRVARSSCERISTSPRRYPSRDAHIRISATGRDRQVDSRISVSASL